MLLRCTKNGKTQLVIGIKQFRNVCEIVENLKVSALRIAIPMRVAAQNIYCPTVIHQSGT